MYTCVLTTDVGDYVKRLLSKSQKNKDKKGNEEGEKQGRRIVVAWDNENTSSWKRNQVSRAQYRVLDRLSDISPRLQYTEL